MYWTTISLSLFRLLIHHGSKLLVSPSWSVVAKGYKRYMPIIVRKSVTEEVEKEDYGWMKNQRGIMEGASGRS